MTRQAVTRSRRQGSMTTSGFRQVYDRHIDCDFCGAMTRGRVWDSAPGVVKCGACGGELDYVDETVS